MSRIVAAAKYQPRAMVGMTSCLADPLPEVGNQPNFTENTKMRAVAITKFGIETPVNATALNALAAQLPDRTADNTPAGMPMARDKVKASEASSSDRGSRSRYTSSTGWRYWKDRPRSPVTMSPTNEPYWASSGRSSPYSARISATSSSEASGPA